MYKNVYERNDNSNTSRSKMEEPSNSVLKLSGSNILCNSYRSKKHLNTPLKAIENIKLTPNIHNNQLLTISNENLPSYKKLPLQIRNNNNLANENYYNFGKNLLLKAINNNNSNLNKNNSSKLYTKTDNNSSSLDLKKINNNKDKFVFLHEIKKIKKKVDLSHKKKSIKNIMDNQVPYDEKNINVAMKPIKILNNFQDFKESEVINKNNNNLFLFLTEKMKISRKNVLIKLLLDQKDTYDKTISSHQKMLTEIKKNIDTDQNNFETLVKSQKQSSKILEDLLEQLLIRKKNLLIEHFHLQFDLRTRKDERMKILEHINDYRIIAKFVTKALGGSGKLFEFRLTTYGKNNNNYIDNDITSEKETQRVLFRFNFLLNPKRNSSYVNQDDIDIFNEITSLNHSNLLFHQLWKKEDSVLNNLKKNEIIEKELIILEESEEKKLENMKNKIEILEKELKYNEEIFEAANKEYESLYNKITFNNSDFEGIITDLYNFVFEENIKKTKKKYYIKDDDYIDVHDYISDLQKELIKKERMMNNLNFELDKIEKEDKQLFDKVVNSVKSENKMIHVNNIKRIQEFGDINKFKLLKIPKDKIILKYKRTEPPYYKAKKEKKIKIEPELIRHIENEELLTYD